MGLLILMRHGQSLWNLKGQFTGWVDVPLSLKGIEEAVAAGKQIKDLPIDVIYVSTLNRALMTAMLAMSQHSSDKVPVIQHPEDSQLSEWGKIYSEKVKNETIPVIQAWQLNERMYGELQGLNKEDTRKEYGEHQVKLWRRSYDVSPPAGESLAMTAERTLPYFRKEILGSLKAGKNVLVSAHGNSLRSIVMELDALNHEEVLNLEIPTGKPLFYRYAEGIITKEL